MTADDLIAAWNKRRDKLDALTTVRVGIVLAHQHFRDLVVKALEAGAYEDVDSIAITHAMQLADDALKRALHRGGIEGAQMIVAVGAPPDTGPWSPN